MRRKPPDILITTPESLYLMISSGAARSSAGVEAVIVDEIHAVAPVEARRAPGADAGAAATRLGTENSIQRIGLSATQRPLERIGELPRRRRPQVRDRGRQRAEAARPRDRRARRGHGRAQPARRTSAATEPTPARRRQYRAEALARADRPGSDRGLARPGHQHALDLAGDLPGAAAARPRAQLDDRLRQQPPRAPSGSPSASTSCTTSEPECTGAARHRARRATRRIGTGSRRRDRPRPPRLARPRGARAGRGAAQVRPAPLPGRHLVAGAGHRHGRRRPRDPGRVAEVRHPRAAADRPRRPHASARSPRAGSSPSSAPTCSSAPWSPAGCASGEIEETVIPQNPLDVLAQHLVSMAALDEWEVDEVEKLVRVRAALLRALPRAARERPRHARRPLSVGALRRAAPADRLGPHQGHDARPAGRAPARRHQRRHDPGPRALRRPPAGRPPGRRARRGDGLRGPSRPDLPARREHLADRGDHPRPGDRHPGPGRPRRGAVLARRRDRPPRRARQGDRRLRPRGGQRRPEEARQGERPRQARRARTSSTT